MADDTWCIILAAGAGRRLESLTGALHGHPVPKQFASLLPGETLLQATVERFAPLVSPARTIVVVARDWEAVARRQLSRHPEIEVVGQPADLGTGPGLLLPLARLRARAPMGTQVVVTPSDHHFTNLDALREAISAAQRASRRAPDSVVLLGADPDRPCPDLGWIVPVPSRSRSSRTARRVASFVEKPSPAVARGLHLRGGLWNTFVMVGTARAFWRQSERFLARLARAFERYSTAIGTAEEGAVLRGLYGTSTPADFSRDVLQRSNELLVVRLSRSGWCDWGTPERLLESLRGTDLLADLQRRLRQGARHALGPKVVNR